MRKVVIINQPLHNRGDQAAHRALVQLLQQQGDIEITVLSIDTSEAVDLFSRGISGVRYITVEPFKKRMQKYFRRVMCMPRFVVKLLQRTPKIKRYNQILKEADYVLCSPGGICMGGYKNWVHIWNLANAIALGKKTGIYGRSIGPFYERKRTDRIFARRSAEILRAVDYLSLRDGYSQQIARDMGIPCVPTIDTAFAVRPEAELPAELGYLKRLRYAVFVPNQLYRWHPVFKKTQPQKFDSLYKAIIGDILRRGCSVVMLPQLFGEVTTDVDYFQTLAKEMNTEDVIVINDKYDSDIQQKIIQQSVFVVGARYHSVIFSIINHVPFVCLSYEHKMEDALQLLGLEQFSLTIEELVSDKAAVRRIADNIDRLVENRDIVVAEIRKASEKAQSVAREAFDAFLARLNAVKQ